MIKIKHLVVGEQGIHARTASVIVSIAKKYSSNIILCYDGEEADMKNLFHVMGLGVKKNAMIEIMLSGEDEIRAAQDVGEAVSAL